MKIELKKFGTTLVSRQLGKEALSAFMPTLRVKEGEDIVIDFDGVITFSPSWADEFITPLQAIYNNRLVVSPSKNPSVEMTLKLLEDIKKIKFRRE
jgi:hypothetical protein